MTLHTVIRGRGNPLVLFHGWGFDHRIWDVMSASLSEHFTVYAVDLPGFGASIHREWDAFKQALLQCVPSEFALIGWSFGGLLATRFAMECPHRVTHLLNIATSPRFVQDEGWPGLDHSVLSAFSNEMIQQPARTWKRFTRLQGAQQQVSSPTVGWDGFHRGLDALQTWDLRANLADLTMPVGYLFGGRDEIVPASLMPVMQTRYPSFLHQCILEAKHAPFLSHTEACLSMLHGFLK